MLARWSSSRDTTLTGSCCSQRLKATTVIGPWMNYPMVSPDQLREILAGTRWHVVHVFDSDDTYVAIIEKTGG